MSLPETLEILPITQPPRTTVRVPGSKSYTNRALIVAALAEGQSGLTGVLESEDTLVMREALRVLGIGVVENLAERLIVVDGCGGRLPRATANLYLANSGTSIRFLTVLVALGRGIYRLDGNERMRQRPIGDLLAALRQLGVHANAELANDCPPVVIRSGGLPGGTVRIAGNVSSQFLSGMLMAAPRAQGPLVLEVEGNLVSQPYVAMTLAVMRAFGVECHHDDALSRFEFPGNQMYRAQTYAIEPDASAASYFFAAAAITGGTVTVEGLGTDSLQGDLEFVRLLERMGCRVAQSATVTTVTGGSLRGINADLHHLSDTVPTLAAVACFAEGPTTIRNVENVRWKESDRISAMATELKRCGLAVEERRDGLTIHPGSIRPTVFQTYNDHRIAMSLALLGLSVPGIVIANPSCVAKTYPEYFSDLTALGAETRPGR